MCSGNGVSRPGVDRFILAFGVEELWALSLGERDHSAWVTLSPNLC